MYTSMPLKSWPMLYAKAAVKYGKYGCSLTRHGLMGLCKRHCHVIGSVPHNCWNSYNMPDLLTWF